MKTMSALEVRRKFGGVLDLVAKKRIPVTICRANRPLAVLVPADEYAVGAQGREDRLRLAAERLSRWKAGRAGHLKGIDVIKLLRQSWESR